MQEQRQKQEYPNKPLLPSNKPIPHFCNLEVHNQVYSFILRRMVWLLQTATWQQQGGGFRSRTLAEEYEEFGVPWKVSPLA